MARETIASLKARIVELEAQVALLNRPVTRPSPRIHPDDAARFAKMQAARAEAMRTGKSVLLK